MGKWDQGLGAIGFIVLAVILTVLVAIGAPMMASHSTLELRDWLAFFGNIVGAVGTLVAAYIAWRAVQSQIGESRSASMLTILMREEDRLEDELFAINGTEDVYYAIVPQHDLSSSDYRQRILDFDLGDNLPAIKESLDPRLGENCPPQLLDSLALRFIDLFQAVDYLDDVQVQRRQRGPLPDIERRLQHANDDIKAIQLDFDRFMDNRTKRKAEIVDTLLPRCRRSIEVRLLNLHD